MKKLILILTVFLFTLTANAASFTHYCQSNSYNDSDYYSEDIYVDSYASVSYHLDGATPGSEYGSAEIYLVSSSGPSYGSTTWDTGNIPSFISPGNWMISMYADGNGGDCSLGIYW